MAKPFQLEGLSNINKFENGKVLLDILFNYYLALFQNVVAQIKFSLSCIIGWQ